MKSLQEVHGSLPKGFVYLTDVAPDVILEMRYYSTYNFTGARIDDYLAPVAILSKEAADAIKKVSDHVMEKGYVLKIWDTYRPQGAVDHLVRWAADLEDDKMKKIFYPDLCKSRLIPEGLIFERSGHSRGSTVDLTLVDRLTGQEVDMGSSFDFFGEVSSHSTDLVTKEQADNRLILKDAMVEAGFVVYDPEWWHYTLANEPHPDTYFDFPVK